MTSVHVNDIGDVDLTDATLYRHGFPHDVFTEMRAKAPVRPA